MLEHVKATTPGLVGNCTTGAAFTIAWIADDVTPVLHALSLFVGCLAGLATAAYYFAMWHKAHKQASKPVRPTKIAKKKRRG